MVMERKANQSLSASYMHTEIGKEKDLRDGFC